MSTGVTEMNLSDAILLAEQVISRAEEQGLNKTATAMREVLSQMASADAHVGPQIQNAAICPKEHGSLH